MSMTRESWNDCERLHEASKYRTPDLPSLGQLTRANDRRTRQWLLGFLHLVVILELKGDFNLIDYLAMIRLVVSFASHSPQEDLGSLELSIG